MPRFFTAVKHSGSRRCFEISTVNPENSIGPNTANSLFLYRYFCLIKIERYIYDKKYLILILVGTQAINAHAKLIEFKKSEAQNVIVSDNGMVPAQLNLGGSITEIRGVNTETHFYRKDVEFEEKNGQFNLLFVKLDQENRLFLIEKDNPEASAQLKEILNQNDLRIKAIQYDNRITKKIKGKTTFLFDPHTISWPYENKMQNSYDVPKITKIQGEYGDVNLDENMNLIRKKFSITFSSADKYMKKKGDIFSKQDCLNQMKEFPVASNFLSIPDESKWNKFKATELQKLPKKGATLFLTEEFLGKLHDHASEQGQISYLLSIPKSHYCKNNPKFIWKVNNVNSAKKELQLELFDHNGQKIEKGDCSLGIKYTVNYDQDKYYNSLKENFHNLNDLSTKECPKLASIIGTPVGPLHYKFKLITQPQLNSPATSFSRSSSVSSAQ